MAVELSSFLLQFVDNGPGVGVEQVNETLQHVQVEGRSDQLAVIPPLLTCDYKSNNVVMYYKTWRFEECNQCSHR